MVFICHLAVELFIIYRFRFAFIAPGISPPDFFRLEKIVIAKIRGEQTRYFHDFRAIIEDLSTHFAEDKLVIYLVHRLTILRVMRECSNRKYVPFGLASEPIKCLHRQPLGLVIDGLNTSASLLEVRFVFKRELSSKVKTSV